MKKGISFLMALLICLSAFIYPIGINAAADTVVVIGDSVLRNSILAELGLSSASQLTKDSISKLTQLDISGKSVRSLSGIENAVNLKSLKAANCSITDLADLGSLSKLQTLDVSDNPVSSATGLSSCTALTSLDVSYTAIKSTAFLANLTNLRVLDIAGTPFSNPSASNMPKSLLVLDMSNTKVSSLNAISQLNSITKLNVANTAITNINSVTLPKSLKSLDLSNNKLTAPTFTNLKNIQMLYLSGTGLSNISNISQLSELSVLDISNNSITTLKPLTGLTRLNALDISGNTGISLTELPNLKNLRSLWASDISLTNTTYLSKMTELRLLDVSDNKLNTLAYAVNMNNLITLAADNTGLTGISSASYFTSVEYLSLANNSISNITSLTGLDGLKFLDISRISIDFADDAKQLQLMNKISSHGTQVKTVESHVLNALVSDIDKLPSADDITAAYYDKCVDLVAVFDALSEYEQAKVKNAEKLNDCYDKVINLTAGAQYSVMSLSLSADKDSFDSADDEVTLTLSFSGQSAYPSVDASLHIPSDTEVVSLSSDMAVVEQPDAHSIHFTYEDADGNGVKEGVLGTATVKLTSDAHLDEDFIFTYEGEGAAGDLKTKMTDAGTLTISSTRHESESKPEAKPQSEATVTEKNEVDHGAIFEQQTINNANSGAQTDDATDDSDNTAQAEDESQKFSAEVLAEPDNAEIAEPDWTDDSQQTDKTFGLPTFIIVMGVICVIALIAGISAGIIINRSKKKKREN